MNVRQIQPVQVVRVVISCHMGWHFDAFAEGTSGFSPRHDSLVKENRLKESIQIPPKMDNLRSGTQ